MSGDVIDINELATQMRELEDEERRDFIREHASRLEAAYLTGLAASGRELTIPDAKRAWDLARGLWDAKPEDC